MTRSVSQFVPSLVTRLRRGEHVVLYGPRGSGKTTLLAQLHVRLAARGVPCAISPATAHLDDVTRALEHAYPDVDTAGLARRKARSRLRSTADRREGVLLLDHVTGISTAMIGFLRRLRGGIAGVMLAVDVETAHERERLRRRVLGTASLAMPPMSSYRLRRLFRAQCADLDVPCFVPRKESRILRAARGQPGWVVQCARLATQARYWRDGRLYVTVLCADTEIALRLGHLAPRLQEGETSCKSAQ